MPRLRSQDSGAAPVLESKTRERRWTVDESARARVDVESVMSLDLDVLDGGARERTKARSSPHPTHGSTPQRRQRARRSRRLDPRRTNDARVDEHGRYLTLSRARSPSLFSFPSDQRNKLVQESNLAFLSLCLSSPLFDVFVYIHILLFLVSDEQIHLHVNDNDLNSFYF